MVGTRQIKEQTNLTGSRGRFSDREDKNSRHKTQGKLRLYIHTRCFCSRTSWALLWGQKKSWLMPCFATITKKKTRSKTTTGLANDSFSCHAALMQHRFLFGYLFLSCWQAFLQVEHCAVVHSHAVCIKYPLCLKWAPRGRPTRWPSHTFLNFKSCTFIPPCSDPQRLIWFGLWILNWPPNWALHTLYLLFLSVSSNA